MYSYINGARVRRRGAISLCFFVQNSLESGRVFVTAHHNSNYISIFLLFSCWVYVFIPTHGVARASLSAMRGQRIGWKENACLAPENSSKFAKEEKLSQQRDLFYSGGNVRGKTSGFLSILHHTLPCRECSTYSALCCERGLLPK